MSELSVAAETLPVFVIEKAKWTIGRVLAHVVLAVFAFIVLFPLYWMFVTSIRPKTSISTAGADLWPDEVTLHSYRDQRFRLWLSTGS